MTRPEAIPTRAEVIPDDRTREVLMLAGVLLVGGLLLLSHLGDQSLWVDEMLTAGPALGAQSLADLWARVRVDDTQPPVSHALLYALQPFLPHGEFGLRLPSLVAMELGLVLLYVTLRRLWDARVALTATTLAQISPFLGFFAAELRNYGLWFLAITGSLWLLVSWIERATSNDPHEGVGLGWALAWGLVNGIGLWVHLFHVFLVLGEVAVLAILLVSGRPRRPWSMLATAAAAQVVMLAVFAPWLAVLAASAAEGHAGVSWTRALTPKNLIFYPYALHFGFSFGPNLREFHVAEVSDLLRTHGVSLGLAGLAMLVTGGTYLRLVVDALRRPELRWELLLLVVGPVAAVAGPLAYGALAAFPLHPRHLLFVWPLVPLVLALGLRRVPRLRVPIAFVVLLQLIALRNLLFEPYYAKDDERGAVRFAESRSGKVAYVLGDVAAFYCVRATCPVKNFTDFPPDVDDVWFVDNRTWEEQNPRYLARLRVQLAGAGFEPEEATAEFRGIVLRHWRARRS